MYLRKDIIKYNRLWIIFICFCDDDGGGGGGGNGEGDKMLRYS